MDNFLLKNKMSIFKFFTTYTKEEKELIDFYTQKYLQGLTFNKAKKLATELIDRCISKSKMEGLYDIKNLGDLFLENEDKYPEFKEIKKEGVQDIDIQWFWNMSDVARKATIEEWQDRLISTFKCLLDQGLTKEDATIRIRKSMPTYSLDKKNLSKETNDVDRALPYEIKNIIELYISKTAVEIGGEKLKSNIEKFSSFNAFIRDAIKKEEFSK